MVLNKHQSIPRESLQFSKQDIRSEKNLRHSICTNYLIAVIKRKVHRIEKFTAWTVWTLSVGNTKLTTRGSSKPLKRIGRKQSVTIVIVTTSENHHRLIKAKQHCLLIECF
jgi:hypothetical protein